MTRAAFVCLSLAILLVACKPAGKPPLASAKKDTATVAVQPGDTCPPLDTARLAASMAQESARTAARPASPDTARKPAPPPVKRESAAARPKTDTVPSKPAALPKLWDFGSDNCIPCKQMMPILEDMAKEFAGRIDIRIINVYKEGALSNQYRIQVIPTQVFIDASGKELFRHVGFYPRDSMLAKFRQFGFTK